MPRWPHSFAKIAGLVGDDDAIRLCRRYGGLECYIPKRAAEGHQLVAAIGLEAAAKLSEAYGGSKVHPPISKAALKADIAEADGSLTEIARRFRVTRRWVCRVKAGKI